MPGFIHNGRINGYGHIRIFHDARNDQVMMSIEVSFIYTFFFPVNVGCVRVCLGLIILFILFFIENLAVSVSRGSMAFT